MFHILNKFPLKTIKKGVKKHVLMTQACTHRVPWFSLLLQSANMEVVSRMYLAMVLFTLLKETNLWNVAEKFQLSRGFIQTLLSSASAFCSCVLHFTEVSSKELSAVELTEPFKCYLQIAETNAYKLLSHQELEEFWPFKALLTELTRKLSYCVRAELIPLMEVAGVMEVSVDVKFPVCSFVLSGLNHQGKCLKLS